MATINLQTEKSGFNSSSQTNNLPVNVNWPERMASITVGVRLLSGGIRKLTSHPIRNLILTLAGGYLLYRGLTGNCPLYSRLNRRGIKNTPSNINIRKMLIVDKPRRSVYAFWRQLKNLPLFMTHLSKIKEIDEKRSHWEIKIPGNVAKIGWDVDIITDEPGHEVAWRSVPDSLVDTTGKVEFSDTPGNDGTIIEVTISYKPPKNNVVSMAAKLLSPVFEKLVKDDVARFKEYAESNMLTHTTSK